MDVGDEGVPRIEWDSSKDDIKALRYIARLAMLIGPLRGVVDVWDTEKTQGSDYGFTIPIVEEPHRANQQLYNLAKGHALIEGRNYVTVEDVPLLIKVVLSTAPIARVAIFEMLLGNRGTLRTADIEDGLGISHPTVYKTMAELELLGLVDVKKEGDFDNSPKTMTLKRQYKWCLGTRFRQLREGFSPARKARNVGVFGKRGSNQGDNMESDSTKLKEMSGVVTHKNIFSLTFWTLFDALSSVDPKGESRVIESTFKAGLIASGEFTAGEAAQAIKDAIDNGRLTRLEFDLLVKNSQANTSKSEGK
jgi:hypothetical protein